MSTVVDVVGTGRCARTSPDRPAVKIALLGVGHVGAAVAALVRTHPLANRFNISAGLVRDINRPRPGAQDVALTRDVFEALHGDPDIVIEVLGGLEPARTLVLDAIERGIPVVTANKSLLAVHGAELLAAARRHGVPFRYEAAVLAGVPFLGTFNRRPLARAISAISGIVNGTTNFILSRMSDAGEEFRVALLKAQQCGYAEPDPTNDVGGVDAVEKLCILVRHFGNSTIFPCDVERTGIDAIHPEDLQAARRFGGVLKPVVHASWNAGCSAFAGPAFVANGHPLSRIDGVQNAVLLGNEGSGDLFFAGPGAGPEVTAATLIDDAIEAIEGGVERESLDEPPRRISVEPPRTSWFVRVEGSVLDTAALSMAGVAVRRAAADAKETLLLTEPSDRDQIERAVREVQRSVGSAVSAFRALEKV
jgi:homoserine dehydrogenase